VSTPDDKKIDFEELRVTQDFEGSLEPIPEEASAGLLSELEAESEARKEKSPEEEEITERSETPADAGAAVSAKSKFRNLVERLSAADPFTVMLSIAVAALLIAIFICLVELGRYGFDVRAKKAKSTVTISAPMDLPRSFC
jgi:hypothetical protein